MVDRSNRFLRRIGDRAICETRSLSLALPIVSSEKRPPEGTRIWVIPNNTGGDGISDDFAIHHEHAEQLLKVMRRKADQLGVILLVPSFPRPRSDETAWGTVSLDRQTMTRTDSYGRLDQQLLGMIEDARSFLARDGHATCDKFFIGGFSAGGMFSNRFTLIHPEFVAAATIGAPGGWPMVPVKAYEGRPLNYPAGIADYADLFGRPFPQQLAKEVPFFFYVGAEDGNDATPFSDSFPADVGKTVQELFGPTPNVRWAHAESLFDGYKSKWFVEPGIAHEVSPQMDERIVQFLGDHLVCD